MRKFLSIAAGLSFLAASNSFGTDPGAHTIRMWDNTDNAMVNATIGANLTYTQATHTLSAAGGSVVRTVTAKWNDLAGGALATGSSKLAVKVPYSGTKFHR